MKKFQVCFFLFITIVLSSCTRQNSDLYLFRYDKYFNIFNEKKQSFIEANRFFRKSNYNVRHIRIQKFADLQREYEVVKTKSKANTDVGRNTVFFLDNLCFNTYMATSNHPDTSNFKFITYNYEQIRKEKYPKYSTMNFVIDFDLIYKTITDQIKDLSAKDDFSDVVYLYGSNYTIANKISEQIKQQLPAVRVQNVTGTQSLKNWINSNKDKYNVFVVFAMEYNQGLTSLDADKVTDKKFVEVFTNFGASYDFITRSILIDEVKTVQHCLHSPYLKKFLAEDSQQPKNKKSDKSKNVTTTTTVKKQNKKAKTTVTTVQDSADKKTKKEQKKEKQKVEILSKGVTNVNLTQANCLKVVSHKKAKSYYGFELEKKIQADNEKKEKLEAQGIKEKNIFLKIVDFFKAKFSKKQDDTKN